MPPTATPGNSEAGPARGPRRPVLLPGDRVAVLILSLGAALLGAAVAGVCSAVDLPQVLSQTEAGPLP